jgi:hypothetical protein
MRNLQDIEERDTAMEKILVAWVRKDWFRFVRFQKPVLSFTHTQPHKRMCLPSFFDRDSKYIDARSRFDKVRVEITIRECPNE